MIYVCVCIIGSLDNTYLITNREGQMLLYNFIEKAYYVLIEACLFENYKCLLVLDLLLIYHKDYIV